MAEDSFSAQGGTDVPITEQVKQQTQHVVQQGQQAAGALADQVSSHIKSQLGNQKEHLVTGLISVANALLQTSNNLRDQGQTPMGQYVNQAAERITQLSGYLRQKEVDEFIADANNFARSRPALFLCGATALGLIAGRFLKSSGRSAASGASDQMATNAPAL